MFLYSWTSLMICKPKLIFHIFFAIYLFIPFGISGIYSLIWKCKPLLLFCWTLCACYLQWSSCLRRARLVSRRVDLGQFWHRGLGHHTAISHVIPLASYSTNWPLARLDPKPHHRYCMVFVDPKARLYPYQCPKPHHRNCMVFMDPYQIGPFPK